MLNYWDQIFSLMWSFMPYELVANESGNLSLQNYLGVNSYLHLKLGVLRYDAACADSDLCAWFPPRGRGSWCLKIWLLIKCRCNLNFVSSNCPIVCGGNIFLLSYAKSTKKYAEFCSMAQMLQVDTGKEKKKWGQTSWENSTMAVNTMVILFQSPWHE